MTLNITVVSYIGIHQSSDLRLTGFISGPNGQLFALEDNSPKLITLMYDGWAGYLTYCGVGKWDHKPAFISAAEWIVSLGRNPTFEDVVQVLESRGSEWISSIQSRHPTFLEHSFIIAAFERKLPRVAIISNSHSTKGRLAKHVFSGLRASISPRSAPHVFVTGMDNTVSEGDFVALKRMAKKGAAPKTIRHRMSSINAMAARSVKARNGISDSCICYSIDRNGGGGGEICGKVAGPLVPIQIVNGTITTDVLADLLGPNAKVVQMAFGTPASSNATAAKHIECVLNFGSEGESAGVTGHDLGDLNSFNMKIFSANENGSIVGELRYPPGKAPRAFIWVKGQAILHLPTLGGLTSCAININNMDIVVGRSDTANNVSRAFIWRNGAPLIDLGAMDANNSVASAINDQGIVAGHIYSSLPLPAGRDRAFIWTESEGMKLIPGLEACWSQAHHINNNGQILGFCHLSNQMCSFVYSDTTGLSLIEGSPGRPFFASSINDSGIVVGEAADQNDICQAMVWSADNGLRSLNIPFPFHPKSIDNEGNIVGHDSNRPYSGAWLLSSTGTLVQLPGGKGHNLVAQKIVSGSIFGHAQGEEWKHLHPIRWDIVM